MNSFSIAVIVSRFNLEITSKLLDGARARLLELGLNEEQIAVAHVPGAVEIPLVAQRFAQTGKFQAIIALGAVIRGETTHYETVCDMVATGCQQVSLQYDVPVVFGVLTTENEEQALDRLGGKHGHKGRDAAETAVEMLALLAKLPLHS